MTLEDFKAELLRRFPWEPEAKFMAVDADGAVCQYRHNAPSIDDYHNVWFPESRLFLATLICMGKIDIPAGIDWRDTLITRPTT